MTASPSLPADFIQCDAQLGHLLVVPLENPASDEAEGFSDKDDDPLMLLALSSAKAVTWQELTDIVHLALGDR